MSGCQSDRSQRASSDGLLPEIRAPQTIKFDRETYTVKHSAIGQKWAVVEYYRTGEGPKSWKQMLTLRLDLNGLDSGQQVTNIDRVMRAKTFGGAGFYATRGGYSIEFFEIKHGGDWEDISRYWDRRNGTVSLQCSHIISSAELHEDQIGNWHGLQRHISVDMSMAMGVMYMPDIEICSPPTWQRYLGRAPLSPATPP